MRWKIGADDSRTLARLKLLYLIPIAALCLPLIGLYLAVEHFVKGIHLGWTHQPPCYPTQGSPGSAGPPPA